MNNTVMFPGDNSYFALHPTDLTHESLHIIHKKLVHHKITLKQNHEVVSSPVMNSALL